MCTSTMTDSSAETSDKTTPNSIISHRNSTKNQKEMNDSQYSTNKKEESKICTFMQSGNFRASIKWPDLIVQIFLHVGSIYAIHLLFFAKLLTVLWLVISIIGSGFGITAGAHRLWSHKSYTASIPVRLLLIFLFTIAGQRDAYTWALDHRIHHKFTETDADPHNVNRGFWFAHIGWVVLTAHPKTEEKRKIIDMTDLENDGIVQFQKTFFIPLFGLLTILFPVIVPIMLWNEDMWLAFWICFVLRFTFTLNVAFCVNSVAHMWGHKPYDKQIKSVESPLVSFFAFGEGWHNYHHVFPWDYKTGEFGSFLFNPTTVVIDLFAKMGLVSGRKTVSKDMVDRRAKKCGDGSHGLHNQLFWGFGDADVPKEDVKEILKMNE